MTSMSNTLQLIKLIQEARMKQAFQEKSCQCGFINRRWEPIIMELEADGEQVIPHRICPRCKKLIPIVMNKKDLNRLYERKTSTVRPAAASSE